MKTSLHLVAVCALLSGCEPGDPAQGDLAAQLEQARNREAELTAALEESQKREADLAVAVAQARWREAEIGEPGAGETRRARAGKSEDPPSFRDSAAPRREKRPAEERGGAVPREAGPRLQESAARSADGPRGGKVAVSRPAELIGTSFDDVKSQTGRVFRNVTVKSVDDLGVTFEHEYGVANLKFPELSSDMQEMFHYDEAQFHMKRIEQRLRAQDGAADFVFYEDHSGDVSVLYFDGRKFYVRGVPDGFHQRGRVLHGRLIPSTSIVINETYSVPLYEFVQPAL